MAEDRATNPYDADGWTSEIEVIERVLQIVTTGVSLKLCDTDPRRLWLLVSVIPAASGYVLWPRRQLNNHGIAPMSGQTHVLIHNASYPSLVQGEWWIWNSAILASAQIVIGRDMS